MAGAASAALVGGVGIAGRLMMMMGRVGFDIRCGVRMSVVLGMQMWRLWLRMVMWCRRYRDHRCHCSGIARRTKLHGCSRIALERHCEHDSPKQQCSEQRHFQSINVYIVARSSHEFALRDGKHACSMRSTPLLIPGFFSRHPPRALRP